MTEKELEELRNMLQSSIDDARRCSRRENVEQYNFHRGSACGLINFACYIGCRDDILDLIDQHDELVIAEKGKARG